MKNFAPYTEPVAIQANQLFNHPIFGDLAPHYADQRLKQNQDTGNVFHGDYPKPPINATEEAKREYHDNIAAAKIFNLNGPSSAFDNPIIVTARSRPIAQGFGHGERMAAMDALDRWFTQQRGEHGENKEAFRQLRIDNNGNKLRKPSSRHYREPLSEKEPGWHFMNNVVKYRKLLESQGYGMNILSEQYPCTTNGCETIMQDLIPRGGNVGFIQNSNGKKKQYARFNEMIPGYRNYLDEEKKRNALDAWDAREARYGAAENEEMSRLYPYYSHNPQNSLSQSISPGHNSPYQSPLAQQMMPNNDYMEIDLDNIDPNRYPPNPNANPSYTFYHNQKQNNDNMEIDNPIGSAIDLVKGWQPKQSWVLKGTYAKNPRDSHFFGIDIPFNPPNHDNNPFRYHNNPLRNYYPGFRGNNPNN